MNFASPTGLLALALIPIALAAYLVARHRRRRYAVRFPGVSVLQELAEPNSWTRYIPTALVLASLALLGVALAKPQTTYRVPVGQTSVMLVSDQSGSMAADDVEPTRLGAAIKAADTFMAQLPSSVSLGAVTFSSSPTAAQAPSTNHDAARAVINGQAADGGTDTGGALQLALQLLKGADPRHPPSAIVLLSDGDANIGPNPIGVAQLARREHIPINSVALGTQGGVLQGPFGQQVPVPPDPQLMKQIADTSRGRTFTAASSDDLTSIYKSLGRHLGTVSRKHQITADFAIAGVVLLMLGGIASVRRWGRLP